ncbi:MAG: FAD-dependent oxidoreductase [Planctomycetota bacterium]|nr:FAD-dependent oxidoreductase [Planctomycetota bacterium]
MKSQGPVVVVGGGIVGVSASLALARSGHSVVVIERESEVGLGSTAQSTAIIRQFYATVPGVQLAREGLHVWQDWAGFLGLAKGNDSDLARFYDSGVLVFAPASDPVTERTVAVMRECGVALEVIPGPEIAKRFEHLDLRDRESDVVGIYESESGFVHSPDQATRNLRSAAEAVGVEFRLGETVVSIESVYDSKRRRRQVTGVRTTREFLKTSLVLNAGGPHSGRINLMARTPLPVSTAPLRQHVVDLDFSRVSGDVPVLADLSGELYVRSRPGSIRLGSLAHADETAFIEDPDQAVNPPAEIASEYEKRWKSLRLGGRPPEGWSVSAGVYDVCVLDWYPIVDRTETDGYFVAIGTSGAWFKGAPVIGELVAELIDVWAREGRDTDRNPLETTLPRSGVPFEMAQLSRHRRPLLPPGEASTIG